MLYNGEVSKIPDFSMSPVRMPRGFHLVKTSSSFNLAQVSDKKFTMFISSPGANNDIPNELIEPALTPMTTS